MNRKILIIEDDPDIAQLVTMHVREAGYEAIHVDNGEQGLQEVEKSNPDLLVLDLMLPGMNGLEVCKQVRKQNERIPILMLTAKSTELDRVLGLELGADDYLTKPFSVVELMARIKALFRRVDALGESQAPPAFSATLEFQNLTIDTARHKVDFVTICGCPRVAFWTHLEHLVSSLAPPLQLNGHKMSKTNAARTYFGSNAISGVTTDPPGSMMWLKHNKY